MKPSEAKALVPGTVLAAKMFGGAARVVVVAVVPSTVKSPRILEVTCKSDYGSVQAYRNDLLEFPTPENEARWARKDAEAAQKAALEATMARVQAALGVKPATNFPGFHTNPTSFTVFLTQEQALALTARLEAATALRAAIRAEFEAEAGDATPGSAGYEQLAAATDALMQACAAWDKTLEAK